MPLDATSAPELPADTREGDVALRGLLEQLSARGYRFTAPTPATHARVVSRPEKQSAHDLRDVFGWSLPFRRPVLPPELLDLVERGDLVAGGSDEMRSRIRVSSLGERLFLHSAYPTQDHDAVFFGPDSQRFATFVENRLETRTAQARIVDIGAGAGVGGILAAELRPGASVLLTDVNAKALRLARINAAHAGVTVETQTAAGFDGVPGAFDAVLINPPYIIDNSGRAYRDGGGMHGARVALDLALQAVERLTARGQLLLYTGAPIVNGVDELRAALAPRLPEEAFTLDYRELDPDVFGEELERPEYAEVERIAVVGAVITRRA